jgi:hypothetical protein
MDPPLQRRTQHPDTTSTSVSTSFSPRAVGRDDSTQSRLRFNVLEGAPPYDWNLLSGMARRCPGTGTKVPVEGMNTFREVADVSLGSRQGRTRRRSRERRGSANDKISAVGLCGLHAADQPPVSPRLVA